MTALERRLRASWAKGDALTRQLAEHHRSTRLLERELALSMGYLGYLGGFVRREALELALNRGADTRARPAREVG